MCCFLIVLLIIIAYFHCKQNGCHSQWGINTQKDAMEIVRARYARGEISSEEFNERKERLSNGGNKK